MTDDKPEVFPRDLTEYSDVLIIRILMGKEVLFLIGDYGEVIREVRNLSRAEISITDGSSPERIVTITGNVDVMQRAFALITTILEKNSTPQAHNFLNGFNKSPITIKLIVPASQCGSLIGKGGTQIKEIRETSGAIVNVASELLPYSTERIVCISGSSEAITEAIRQICIVMLDKPGRRPTVAYQPIGTKSGPIVYCNGKPYILQGLIAIPYVEDQRISSTELNNTASTAPDLIASSCLNQDSSVLAALAGSQLRGAGVSSTVSQNVAHEMAISNDIIGCVIGKGGLKIAQIRKASGAMIKISNTEEHEASENKERTITISGQADAVNVAKTLINLSIDQYKLSFRESKDNDEEPLKSDKKKTSES